MSSNISFEKPKITFKNPINPHNLKRKKIFFISIEELEKEGPKVEGAITRVQLLSLTSAHYFPPGGKTYLFIGKGITPPILGSQPVFVPPIQ